MACLALVIGRIGPTASCSWNVVMGMLTELYLNDLVCVCVSEEEDVKEEAVSVCLESQWVAMKVTWW